MLIPKMQIQLMFQRNDAFMRFSIRKSHACFADPPLLIYSSTKNAAFRAARGIKILSFCRETRNSRREHRVTAGSSLSIKNGVSRTSSANQARDFGIISGTSTRGAWVPRLQRARVHEAPDHRRVPRKPKPDRPGIHLFGVCGREEPASDCETTSCRVLTLRPQSEEHHGTGESC